jgi:hypothetical protein
MFRTPLRSIALAALLLIAGCGDEGTSSPSSPTSPTLSTPPSGLNRPPSITSMDVTPVFGIAGLTEFSFDASATDPEGDPLSYVWSAGDRAFSGARGSVTFPGGGSIVFRVSVADPMGKTASLTRSVVVGTMSGEWRVTSGPLAGATFDLAQSPRGEVTGGYTLPGLGVGHTDAAEPGTITAEAEFTLHVRAASSNFVLSGTMDRSGRTVTGIVDGWRLAEPFTMVRPTDDGRGCRTRTRLFDC